MALLIASVAAQAAPRITITSLKDGDYVGGKITLTAEVEDDVPITAVEFYKADTLVAKDTSPPFTAELDFNADRPDTEYAVTAIAYDAATNTGKTTVTVNTPKNDLQPPGANPYKNGVFFRVWAPHAAQVALEGDFNNLSHTNNRLWKQGEWWFGFQPGAHAGQKYEFRINDAIDRPDPYGREMEHSAGKSIIEDPAAAFWDDGAWRTPAFEDMIIYELHVGTYVGKNDGQHYPGNFKNLLTKLDYIKSMGANMIELLPVHEVPGPDGNTPYLGYAPTGLFAVESSYGTQGSSYHDLQAFVNAAHRKGLGVILDVVYNHFSDASGRDNWYWNYDGDPEGGDGGIYFHGQRTDWGMAPDWERSEVRGYVENNCKYWLREFHVDGLRWDVTTQIANKPGGWTAMRDIIWNVRTAFPGKLFIAEHLPYDREITESGNFNSAWWVEFNHKVKEAFNAEGNADLNAVKEGINGGNYTHVTKRVIYAISHDEARNGSAYLVTEFGGRRNWDARAKARAAAALMLMSPGIPMIWQGEEFAQDSWFNDDYDHAPNWHYENDGDGSTMKQMYRDATMVRWQNDVLRNGSLVWTHQDDNNKVLAFRRDWGDRSVLVVANFGPNSFGSHEYGVSTGRPGQWTQVLCSQDAAYGGWDGAGNALYEPWTGADGKIYINVPKFSVVAMRIK